MVFPKLGLPVEEILKRTTEGITSGAIRNLSRGYCDEPSVQLPRAAQTSRCNEIPSPQHPVAAAADLAAEHRSIRRCKRLRPHDRLSRVKERFIEALLFLAAFSSVAITLGIVGTLAL